MSTGRLRERKKKRQQRKEAAMQLAQMPPEARAAARSEEERISRRIAVMEQVLGPENAGHFEQGMHAPAASSSSPEGRAACNVRIVTLNRLAECLTMKHAVQLVTWYMQVLPTISESPAPSAQGESSDVLSVAGWSHRTPTRPASSGEKIPAALLAGGQWNCALQCMCELSASYIPVGKYDFVDCRISTAGP